jgi:hypothetical protein
MIAYKLIRKLKDGSLSPLFLLIEKPNTINIWLEAESHPTNGFAFRKSWHCTLETNCPTLIKTNRVWVEVEVEDYVSHKRPLSQGGI